MKPRRSRPEPQSPEPNASDPFEELLERLPIGIERIDTAGTILYSNSAHHRLLGYADGELVGRKVYDLVADREERQRLKSYFAVLRNDQPEPEPFIATNVRKDGTTFDMRVDWHYEHDERGELRGFVAAMTDITAQRRAEEERDRTLEELEVGRRHLASLMETAVDFVLYRLAAAPDKPHAGEVVFVSPSIRDIMGIEDPTDFSFWFANIVPEDEARVVEANRISAKTGRPFDEVMRIEHPGKKEVRWIRAISRPILGERGTPLFFNGLILDITRERRAEVERRRLELKLQQSQKLESLGTLAGGIAHDFNNLLVGILGSSDLALQSLPPDSPAQRQVENVVTAAQRAAGLTNQLLAYSGRGSFTVENASLNSLLEEMLNILSTAISKKAHLEVALAGSLPQVRIDVSQVRQVIMNLITNASDSLGNEVGVIRLATSEVSADATYLKKNLLAKELQEGRYVRLDVADTGCGMDAETLDRIFDPFFTTKTGGRGLGLAAVRGIVHGHGGAIHVESTPGDGTTFSILLPVAPELEGRAEDDASRPVHAPGEARTILIVDDEDLVRDVAARMLERHGHEVLSAADGVEGLEVFARHADEIDGVLLDMNMPRMSGRETFARLRELRSDVLVVFSTGYHEKEATDLLDADGAVDFIQKPYRVAELLAKLCGG